jgi:tetratricopeptide (TPR) repeat protein/transcriptional regulator with XRE-family HTH domain
VDVQTLPPFGDLLRQHRAAAGLTQEELAERAGLSVRTLGDLERGVSGAPHRHTVTMLARALALTGDERTAFEGSARRRRALADTPAPQWPAHQSDPFKPVNPTLVGRSRELDSLQRHLTAPSPPVLLLAGEPGIGKSRLLAEARRYGLQGGWSVLDGGCQRRGSQEPFAPVAGALARLLRRRTPAAVRRLLRGCAWLIRLLPELAEMIGEPLPAWTVAPDQERRLIFEAVGRLASNLAQHDTSVPNAGVLLVLDDLQWAGSDAFELLTSLVHPASPYSQPGHQQHLRIVGAYRDTEVQPHDPLGVALADWAHAELVTHYSLAPLAEGDCEHLLDELLAGTKSPDADLGNVRALRDRVLQRAGGVPFFLVSYAQAFGRADIRRAADEVPWDIAQGVRLRVVTLPETARSLLSAAAVAGRACEPAMLADAVARPEEEVLAGLDAACRAGLLIDVQGSYEFMHDVIREVVEADIGSARRTTLHRQVGVAIERLHTQGLSEYFETLAHHFVRGQAWDQALHYLECSGAKATSAGAIREALNHYEQALAVCARLGAPVEGTAASLAEKRGFVCYDSGDFQGAVADFARMRAAASRAGDLRREGLGLAYGGMAAYYGHDFEAAEGLLHEALRVANEGFDDVRLFASVQLCSLLMITGRHAEAAPLLGTAEALAPQVNDPLSQSWWAITGSEVLHWSGRYTHALELLERWQGAVTASHQLLMLLWTRWEAALALGGKGEYGRALRLLDEVINMCAETGESFIRARALNTAGWIHCELQDHLRALELNGQSLALADTIETADTEIRSNARLNLGDSYLALGRLTEAENHFRSVAEVVRHPSPPDRWMLWRYGQHLFHSYGSLWLAHGDTDLALRYADECLEQAEATDSPKNILKARRLRGEVFLVRGQLREAAAELDRTLEMARQLGNPPQLWRTLAVVARLRLAEKHEAAAMHACNEALTVIEKVAAGLEDTALREAFWASAEIRHIRQLADATVLSHAP